MPRTGRVLWLLAYAACAAAAVPSLAAAPEYNPVRRAPVAIGPEAKRLIVGMRATATNTVAKTIVVARRARSYTVTQAQTTPADVQALVQRVGLSLAKSRQFTPSMHVLFLQKTLYGADVEAVLEKLRADPAVQFAAVDGLRYPLVVPTNPLYLPTPGTASGQWYMNTPGPATVEGVPTTDASATDAVSAWGITTGSAGVVIADVDSGILFDHPDLLRAGLGGRLLPGYDFVGQDYDATTGAALGTYLRANDGDGWDPDASDPGDWISSADQQNPLFPPSDCTAGNSTWHGTRVVGVYGAITNNDVGTAGMTWGSPTSPGPWVLPVRALGKCGGYDSDIIAGIQWAAGLPVTNPEGPAVPANPYPADIINLSLGGGTDACASANGAPYQSAFTTVTAMDILIVVSAGNGGMPGQSAPVELPANCSAVVPGVISVAGLRNVGTKVGYSSFGPEVTVSAPAGNCLNSGGACLRSIDTTTNAGLTVPAANGYTSETNPNLGTSFSAPIVSGIAGLMRSVNGNLTPVQLKARLKSSATVFPSGAAGVPTCPTNDAASGECACPNNDSQCGAGMVNAYHAVQAAQLPIAAVKLPTIVAGSDAVLDASGSAASCGRSIATYSWSASGGVSIVSGGSDCQGDDHARRRQRSTLTVTDNMGGTDTATITVTSNSASSSAPASAGNSACPTALQVTPVPPTVARHLRRRASGRPSLPPSRSRFQRECVHADPKQFQRYAARGDDDRQLSRAGFHLHGGQRVVDQHLELDRVERSQHTAERQLHGDVERLERCRRKLYQCSSRRTRS